MLCNLQISVTIHHCMASGATVDISSQISSSAMLVLRTDGNWEVQLYGRVQWHNVRTKFHPNPSSGFRFESWRQTERHTWSSLYTHGAQNTQRSVSYTQLLPHTSWRHQWRVCRNTVAWLLLQPLRFYLACPWSLPDETKCGICSDYHN
jgi:hypothetical protein